MWPPPKQRGTVPAMAQNDPGPSMATTSNGPFPSGIKPLHTPEDATVDIVFIHGLTGNRDKAWTARRESEPWPKALLPSEFPTARILTFGYDPGRRGTVSQTWTGKHARDLLVSLAAYREDDDPNGRPIIFVCHSLGGLVCEAALVTATLESERHLRNILDSTRGIIFLGTPHHGSNVTRWADQLSRFGMVLKGTNLKGFRHDTDVLSEALAQVQDSFHTMLMGSYPIGISCFYEECSLPGVGLVVPKDSAILLKYIGGGIPSNHTDMTKFTSTHDPGFVAVCAQLHRWIQVITTADEPESASLSSTNLYSIIREQIRQPSRDSDYWDRIVKNQHEVTASQQSKIFGLLYQAYFDARARGSMEEVQAHLTAAKIITKQLYPESAGVMDHPFGPEPCLYPASMDSVPRTAISQLLREIRLALEKNKHPGSFGSIFDIGISANTRVTCCVFGSKLPATFVVAKELHYEGCSIPVLAIEDTIIDATMSDAPPVSWLKKVHYADDTKVDLTGYSVGLRDNVEQAGSFGFYGVCQGNIYGFTAAHCAPGAQVESIIASPSTRELTYRLQVVVPYTSFNPDKGPTTKVKQKEADRLLREWPREDSIPGCDIVEQVGSENTRREIKLLGQPFGTVRAISATHKPRVLEEHNRRLEEFGAQPFALPREDGREGDQSRSSIEWCCFEVYMDRYGGNKYSSGKYEDVGIRGSQLLAPNMRVFKYGRTTEDTEGQVNRYIVQKWIDDRITIEIGVVGLTVRGFADPGDSGSLVVTERRAGSADVELYAVGLLIGKSFEGLGLVTPLWAILEDAKDQGLDISLQVDTDTGDES